MNEHKKELLLAELADLERYINKYKHELQPVFMFTEEEIADILAELKDEVIETQEEAAMAITRVFARTAEF